MAINLTYKGLTGLRRTLTGFDETTTVDNLIATIAADEELDTNYYVISKEGDPTNTLSTSYSDSSATVASIGIVTGDVIICKPNTIGTTKQTRQVMKLDIAQKKREGGPDDDDTAVYFRANNSYDLTSLPDTYNDNLPGADDNPNTGGLIQKRPWVAVSALSAPESITESVDGDTISNLQIWYDGSDETQYQPTLPSDEQLITQWNDKSGTAKNANPKGGNNAKPAFESSDLKNTHEYLKFSVDDNLTINPFAEINAATGFTIFVAANFVDTSGTKYLIDTDTGDFGLFTDGGTMKITMNGYAATTNQTVSNNTWKVHTFIYNGGSPSVTYRLDKTTASLTTSDTVPSATGAATEMTLGNNDALTAGLIGTIGEVIMFNKTLGATEYSNVENYLKNKWSI